MDSALISILEKEGYFNLKEINGQICGLYRFIFTTGLVVGIDQYSYKGRYCYALMSEAKEAINSWDGKGDPIGEWIKYKGYPFERTNPNLHES